METESEKVVKQALESLDIYRSLAATYPNEVYRSLLPERLSELSSWFIASGSHLEALEFACEAVEIYRKLTKEDPVFYWSKLIAGLKRITEIYSALSSRNPLEANTVQSNLA